MHSSLRYIDYLLCIHPEINPFKQKYKTSNSDLTGSGRSLDEASAEQDNHRKELQTLRKTLHSLQDKRNKHNQHLHNLQTEKNSIVEQQLKVMTSRKPTVIFRDESILFRHTNDDSATHELSINVPS